MKTIAVMIGNNQSEYIKSLMNEFDKQSRKLGVRLVFLTGYKVLEENTNEIKEYDRTNNYYPFASIYDYVSKVGCDACIICYGPISAIPMAPSLEEIMKLTEDIPRMLLEVKYEEDNVPHVIVDNYNSMSDMVRHLVEDHGYKNVAFLAGPKDNYSSSLRLKAYKDVMQKHNLNVTDDMVVFGDYTIRIQSKINELLDNNPNLDAICCANDSMARACYNVCAKRGLIVGKDIAVTGYDNSDISSKLRPALTTVKHDSATIVSKALDMAVKLSMGEDVSNVEYPTNIIKRCSCGCSDNPEGCSIKSYHPGVFVNDNIDNYDLNNDELKDITVGLAKENSYLISRLWDVSFFVRDFFDNDINRDEYFEKLLLRLRESGLSNAFFFVHKESLIYSAKQTSDVYGNKKHMYFAGGYNEDKNTIIPVKEWHHYQVSSKHGFNQYINEFGMEGNFHSYLLFVGEDQYGVMLSQVDISDNEFLLYISLQISNLLHIYYLKTKEEAVAKEMEHSIERVKESNMILSFISRNDELTKILNRRGFMEQALATIQRIKGHEAIIMFGDLDHLKEINDCFGHADGDYAIKSAAKLLTGLMPRDGFVARIGGDEFIAFIPVPSDASAKDYINTMRDKLKEGVFLFNLTCNKPYFVELSSGFYSFVCDDNVDITKIISSADEILYEDKQKRRKSIKKDR